jgi:hypothetical protein
LKIDLAGKPKTKQATGPSKKIRVIFRLAMIGPVEKSLFFICVIWALGWPGQFWDA